MNFRERAEQCVAEFQGGDKLLSDCIEAALRSVWEEALAPASYEMDKIGGRFMCRNNRLSMLDAHECWTAMADARKGAK